VNDVTIASSRADARAAEAVEQHHALMAGTLALKVEALAALARSGGSEGLVSLRDDLVAWGRDELLPHARAEEVTLYRAAAERPEGRLLVEAMVADHVAIGGLVDDLSRATQPVAAAAVASALRVAFSMHLAKENEQVLPMLVAAPDVSVTELLGGMHELLGGADERRTGPGTEAAGANRSENVHACSCGETDPPSWPELDARGIPHAIRHATIFGALDGVRPGEGLVLLAPHDPLPLLAQLRQRTADEYAVDYLERGPEVWRLAIARRTA
jgi:uncharacterized protein (DUF2249 family)